MKESVGSTVDFNIIIVFIVIVFAFLAAAIVYFKSNKVNNVISNSIEKYEGYNDLAKEEINRNLSSLGYQGYGITCQTESAKKKVEKAGCLGSEKKVDYKGGEEQGYCVYYCEEGEYYYYKIKTRMLINLPIINNVLNLPIFSNTSKMYDFEKNLG